MVRDIKHTICIYIWPYGRTGSWGLGGPVEPPLLYEESRMLFYSDRYFEVNQISFRMLHTACPTCVDPLHSVVLTVWAA